LAPISLAPIHPQINFPYESKDTHKERDTILHFFPLFPTSLEYLICVILIKYFYPKSITFLISNLFDPALRCLGFFVVGFSASMLYRLGLWGFVWCFSWVMDLKSLLVFLVAVWTVTAEKIRFDGYQVFSLVPRTREEVLILTNLEDFGVCFLKIFWKNLFPSFPNSTNFGSIHRNLDRMWIFKSHLSEPRSFPISSRNIDSNPNWWWKMCKGEFPVRIDFPPFYNSDNFSV
jgi:hypothetical protein